MAERPPDISPEQATLVVAFVEGWLWGAGHEDASRYLQNPELVQEMVEQMHEGDCGVSSG